MDAEDWSMVRGIPEHKARLWGTVMSVSYPYPRFHTLLQRSKANQNTPEQPVGWLRLQAIKIVDDRNADCGEPGPAI